jgi:hypothetical protein
MIKHLWNTTAWRWATQLPGGDQPLLLREVFGSLPFRSVIINPDWLAWNDRCVAKLAQAAYDDRELGSGHLDTTRLSILADALEEAGCSYAEMLTHLGGPSPHVRGCWVLDLLLGKE